MFLLLLPLLLLLLHLLLLLLLLLWIISSVISFMLHRKLIDILISKVSSPNPYSFSLFLQPALLKNSFECTFLYTTKCNACIYLVYNIKNGTQWITVPRMYVLISYIFGCQVFTGSWILLWGSEPFNRPVCALSLSLKS